jgi:hypothetical protein
VAAENFAVGCDQFAGGLRDLLALLFEIGGDELLVVAAGDEADLLRVGLLGERQSALRATSRTSGLVRRPSGNSVREAAPE